MTDLHKFSLGELPRPAKKMKKTDNSPTIKLTVSYDIEMTTKQLLAFDRKVKSLIKQMEEK